MKKLTITILLICFLCWYSVSQTFSLDYSFKLGRHYYALKKVSFDSSFRVIALKTYYPDTSSRKIIYKKNGILILKDSGDILCSQKIDFDEALINITKNNNSHCLKVESLFGSQYADIIQSLFGVGPCKIEVSILKDSSNGIIAIKKILYYENTIDTLKEYIFISKETKKVIRLVLQENYEKHSLEFSYDKKNRLKEIKSSYITYKIFYKRNQTNIKLFQGRNKIGQLRVISSKKSLTFEYFFISGILRQNYFGEFEKYLNLLIW